MCLRKKLFDLLFDFFSTESLVLELRRVANGAEFGDVLRVAAVVAGEFVQKFMYREAYVAVFAFRYIRAAPALQVGCISAPVLKQDDLLVVLQCFSDFFEQQGSEMTFHLFFAVCFFGIGYQNIGQFHLAVTLIESHVAVFSGFGVEIAFDGRSGTAEQGVGTVERSQHDGCIAGVVSRRRIKLLVACLVLFVHNDQSQFTKWYEKCRTCPYYYFTALVVQQGVPDFHPLGIREAGMIHGEFIAENTFQAGGELCGQCNFRYQVKHLLLFGQGFFYQVDVEFGLTARRNAVKQHCFHVGKLPVDFFERCLLIFVERMFFFREHFRAVEPSGFFLIDLQHIPSGQAVEHGRRATRLFEQFFL